MIEPQLNENINLNQDIVNLVFINSDVEGYNNLLSKTTSNTEAIILDSNRDGIEQISKTLAGREEIDSRNVE